MEDITAHSLYAIGKDPVSSDNPCGENFRYEAEFEQLEAELAKQESLNAETVDWNVVVELSSRIIKNSSKDLLVAAYLCNGLLIKEGYPGLAVGLNILGDMVEQHWDCLFPPAKRMRARATAFSWLAEKAAIQLAANLPTDADANAVIAAADSLKQLDNALVEKMGDQAPMLTELSTPLKSYRQSAEAEAAKQEKAAEPVPAAEPSSAQASAETVTPAPSEAVDSAAVAAPAPVAAKPKAAAVAVADAAGLESEADSKKILRQLQSTIRDVASYWLGQKLSDSRAYRLARQSVWMVIDAAPPDNNGVTQINPPPPERLKYFEAQQEKGDAAALVAELEKTLARSPFWIDGHCQVVKCLRSLGAEYDAAVQSVIRELNNFLSRLPEVAGLSFSDESPFASDQTRLWLDAEVINQGGEAAPTASADGSAGDPWNQALGEARQLLAGGDSDKALAIMNHGLAGAAQMRDQVYWRCALAELLLLSGSVEAAAGMLETISRQALARQMAEWEPQLLAKIYNLLFQAYQKLQKSKKDDKSIKEKTEQAFEQLCWFDPVTALSVKGG